MTVAPRKKTLDEICDIDELEKMVKKNLKINKSIKMCQLDEESDYEARKAIRSRLRSLHKAKTAEIGEISADADCVNRFCDLQSSSLTK